MIDGHALTVAAVDKKVIHAVTVALFCLFYAVTVALSRSNGSAYMAPAHDWRGLAGSPL
jgi:hypothetical protein